MSGTLADVGRLEMFAESYRNWIEDVLDPEGNYRILLNALFEYEFTWTVEFDDNRAEDGCYLRERFESISGIECRESYLDWPCSVLEMMFALAIKIEDTVMYDPEKGDRTSEWFWLMVRNLELDCLTDRAWTENPEEASWILSEAMDCLLNRKYRRDGSRGGLFPQKRTSEDQRKIEIWDQMNEYMSHVRRENV